MLVKQNSLETNMSENAKVVFRVSMARAKKDQAKLLKKAASL